MVVYVEVEVLSEGQWSVGPMYLDYTEDGARTRKKVSNAVGAACTTPVTEACVPGQPG